MNLCDLIHRQPPSPWEGEAKIPWNDPAFSARMLENHLSQDHDWASRRSDIIRAHVDWIVQKLPRPPARILDFACGPGLYTHLLAQHGHQCAGVDFSPASIAYARSRAEELALPPNYILADIRHFEIEQTFDCILMTFGEINVFPRNEAEAILANCRRMLRPGGLFILEAHTFEAVRDAGLAAASWQSHVSGLFSEAPHLLLQENLWHQDVAVAASRYYVVDGTTAGVTMYASSMQAYSQEEYNTLLATAELGTHSLLKPEAWPSGTHFEGRLQVFTCAV